MSTARRLDAHLHLWDPALGVYTWLTAGQGDLHRAFTAPQAAAELAAAGVDNAILVQAADDAQDTRAMLEVAAAHDWVAGVVGWVDLEQPAAAQQSLEEWSDSAAFCGVRQLVHDDARDDLLDLPGVRATLAVCARRGVPVDLPDAYPRLMGAATRLAQDLDELVVVIDHLAKPPRGSAAFEPWQHALRQLGGLPNVVAKVSGLEVSGQPWNSEAVRPAWDTALEAFGPERLMFGSDWPMTTVHAGYRGTVEVIAPLIGELSASEQSDLWWGTAARTYHLALTG
ncbi:hypothetical protein UB45_13335 [Terrabacter sp. 28]|nr:hypothetical protein UB45_13335 [Terrabacter sp. 28]